MKYLLFAGDTYYPSGGWDDFVGAFDSIDAAKAGVDPKCGWAQVVDMNTLNEVAALGYWGHRGSKEWRDLTVMA